MLTYEPMLATVVLMLHRKGQVYNVIKPCKTKNLFWWLYDCPFNVWRQVPPSLGLTNWQSEAPTCPGGTLCFIWQRDLFIIKQLFHSSPLKNVHLCRNYQSFQPPKKATEKANESQRVANFFGFQAEVSDWVLVWEKGTLMLKQEFCI